MNRRTARMLAAGVTAVILVIIGIVMSTQSSGTGSSPQPTAAIAQPTSAPVSQPAVATAAQPTAQPALATAAQPATAYTISADQAGTIALTSAPGAKLSGTPGLVSYQGATVYEVTLDAGMVYVDATSGQVVASTVNGAATSGAQGGEGGEGGEHEGGEHEGGEHEDR